VASRFYQLRTGHALTGPYLKKIGKRASDTCWILELFVEEKCSPVVLDFLRSTDVAGCRQDRA